MKKLLLALIVFALTIPSVSQATDLPSTADPARINEQILEQFKERRPKAQIVEPEPEFKTSAPEGSETITFTLEDIKIEGSTVYSKEELEIIFEEDNPTVDHTNFDFVGLYGSDNSSLFTTINTNFGAIDINTSAGTYNNAVSATIGDTTNYTITNNPLLTDIEITAAQNTVETLPVTAIKPVNVAPASDSGSASGPQGSSNSNAPSQKGYNIEIQNTDSDENASAVSYQVDENVYYSLFKDSDLISFSDEIVYTFFDITPKDDR